MVSFGGGQILGRRFNAKGLRPSERVHVPFKGGEKVSPCHRLKPVKGGRVLEGRVSAVQETDLKFLN
jgi:hypothetical protein